MPNRSTVRTKIGWYIIKYLLAGLLLGAVLDAPAQSPSDPAPALERLAGRLGKEVEGKVERINNDLLRKSIRFLQAMEAKEEKIKRKLVKKGIDPAGLFAGADGQWGQLRKKLEAGEQTVGRMHINYIARLDTLQTGLGFLAGAASGLPQLQEDVQHALGSIRGLQNRFRQTEEVEQWMAQRSRLLQQQLGRWGMTKEIKGLQEKAYYYRAQLQQYKDMLNDPSKLEREALRLLKDISSFRQFFQTHSWLAGMFSLPGQGGETALVKISGLQTREQVAQSLAQRFGAPVQVQQLVQQQGKGALPALDRLRNGLPKKEGNTDADLPPFSPNNQKTRRFKERLELGANIQTGKANRFFPSATDIGLSVGYKLNDRSTIGMGGAYRMGWGSGIRHISITHEGMGMRSFVDYKLKGNFWLSGGAELTYRSRFHNFEILNDYSAWQKTALIGISRKYTVSKKLKGNAQLLYDFLWKQQVPRTQALHFRIGYNFK